MLLVHLVYFGVFSISVITQKATSSHHEKIRVTHLDLTPEGKMPIVGVGTYLDSGENLEKALESALSLGYRHIDTSFSQQSKRVVGKVINRWLSSGKLNRSDLFVAAKLSPGLGYESIPKYLKKTLKLLQLDYVDLYHLHMPMGYKDIGDELVSLTAEENFDYESDRIGMWKGMEEQVDAGLAKSIGICMFDIKQLTRLLKIARIKPSNHQTQINLYHQDEELVSFCKANNITVTAFFSLGNPEAESHPPNVLGDPIVKEMTQKYKKTSAQILLRHLVQKEITVLPKTLKKERLKESIDIFDFVLSEEDMKTLNGLDKGLSVVNYTLSEAIRHPEYPFKIETV